MAQTGLFNLGLRQVDRVGDFSHRVRFCGDSAPVGFVYRRSHPCRLAHHLQWWISIHLWFPVKGYRPHPLEVLGCDSVSDRRDLFSVESTDRGRQLHLGTGFSLCDRGNSRLGRLFPNRSAQGSVWILLDGIVSLILGVLVWRQWPSNSLWVIGTLVGVSMIMTGVTRLMISLAASRIEHCAA